MRKDGPFKLDPVRFQTAYKRKTPAGILSAAETTPEKGETATEADKYTEDTQSQYLETVIMPLDWPYSSTTYLYHGYDLQS